MANVMRAALRSVWRPTRKFILSNLGPVGKIQYRANARRYHSGLGFRWVNLRNPQRFTDKLLWRRLHERYDDAYILADKIEVRDYVRSRIGADVLMPIAAIYADPDLINLDDFPDKFVLKPNHASGMIYFGSRDTADREQIVALCREWLSIDYGEFSGEYQYLAIPRKIMVEPDLRAEMNVESLVDYKFYCFNGAPKFALVVSGRFESQAKQYYDMEWRRQPFSLAVPTTGPDVPPPAGFEFMKDAAAKLAEGRTFVRVDFYEINGRVLFGEITFFPGGGFGPVLPDQYDFKLGRLLTLPDVRAA